MIYPTMCKDNILCCKLILVYKQNEKYLLLAPKTYFLEGVIYEIGSYIHDGK